MPVGRRGGRPSARSAQIEEGLPCNLDLDLLTMIFYFPNGKSITRRVYRSYFLGFLKQVKVKVGRKNHVGIKGPGTRTLIWTATPKLALSLLYFKASIPTLSPPLILFQGHLRRLSKPFAARRARQTAGTSAAWRATSRSTWSGAGMRGQCVHGNLDLTKVFRVQLWGFHIPRDFFKICSHPCIFVNGFCFARKPRLTVLLESILDHVF